MSIWDLVIVALIGAAVVLAIRRIRAGKGGCSCGCEGCEKSCTKREKES